MIFTCKLNKVEKEYELKIDNCEFIFSELILHHIG